MKATSFLILILIISGTSGNVPDKKSSSSSELVSLITEAMEIRQNIDTWETCSIKMYLRYASVELLKTLGETIAVYNDDNKKTIKQSLICLNEHMERFLKGCNPQQELSCPPTFCKYIRDAYVHYDDEQKKNHRGRVITVLERFKIVLERAEAILDRTIPER